MNMNLNSAFNNLKRAQSYAFCRVSQADGPRGSAAPGAADSDGKRRMAVE